MGFLEDLAKAGNDALQSVSNFGQDAAAAVDQAVRNTATLAGSGFNGKSITGPLADVFGSDPQAFIISVANKTRKASRELCVRVAERTQKLNYTFPTPRGQRKVTTKPPSNANPNQIALTLVLAAMDAPATMVEEAGRMANGLGVKERGLMGYTVYPINLPRGLNGIDGDDDHIRERGFFGLDDAALLALIVPIIGAIAAAVLPGLIAAAGSVVKAVTGGGGPTPEQQAQQAAAAKAEETKKTTITIAVVVVVVLVGGIAVFVATRKKG